MTGYKSKKAAVDAKLAQPAQEPVAWQTEQKRTDPLAWARALKAKEEAGARLPQAIKEMWRRALKHSD